MTLDECETVWGVDAVIDARIQAHKDQGYDCDRRDIRKAVLDELVEAGKHGLVLLYMLEFML